MADQYCLKWNNHQQTLLGQFETLLDSNDLTDCMLSAEGKYLNAHKVILSACSPYFAKCLSEMKDKHPVFFMKDVAFEELKGLVEYMYKGEVNVTQDRLDSFLKTASSLQIKGLADQDGRSSGDEEPRAKRKPPDRYEDMSSPAGEEPRSPKRRRRPRPVSQDSPHPTDQNHCDTTTSFPAAHNPPSEVVMPTPMVPVKKTEPMDPPVTLKTEAPDDSNQVDVQDLTLDDDDDFAEEMMQPGTSYSESSQDFTQWQQQLTNATGSEEIGQFLAGNAPSQNNTPTNQSGSQGEFRCTCGRSYTLKHNLKRHQDYECGKEPRYQCPHCPFRSKLSSNLSQHIEARHNPNPRMFKCKLCDYSKKTMRSLKHHCLIKHNLLLEV